jgi:hypothetical protein
MIKPRDVKYMLNKAWDALDMCESCVVERSFARASAWANKASDMAKCAGKLALELARQTLKKKAKTG